MHSSDRSSNFIRLVALLLFAFSGCAGLIYESVWTQYLGLFLGHAAYAQSLVLAIFMGGMAIGAWWISARAPRWSNLLRAYAGIELAIGIAAAVFHPVYLGATAFAYDHAFPAFGGDSSAVLFKWSLAVLLIFPQAVLLGATFPLMSNGLMRRLRDVDGAILSGLYFTNSMGAALGALIATFLLLPSVGLPGAMRFAAVLNILVAAVAFLLSRDTALTQDAKDNAISNPVNVPSARLLLVAAFVTGATSFVYELGWVRMLCLVFGASMHAFELMLAAFVGGIALGGFWIRKRIDGYAQPMRVGGYAQVLMGLAALLSLMLYDHSFDWVAWFMGALSKTDGGYVLFNVVTAAGAIVIMLPAAFFAGMTLPLFTLTLIRNGGGEASVGRIYAANTLGAIAGVFLMVHVMLPAIGLKLSMMAAAAGDLALGMLLLRKTLTTGQWRHYIATGAACAVALAATSLFARFDPMAMGGGVYRDGIARFSSEQARMIFYRDGKTASIASAAINGGSVLIATNGKADASIQLQKDKPPAPDELTMIMSGLLPLATHPDPHTAAVIGFGSGLTTHTLLGDPRLEQVDTIEIEPAMYDGAKVFGARVAKAYTDPRSHVWFDDAKTYFSTNQTRYDIIMSEPSNPWVNGVASLFTQEFYRFIPRHLKRGGVFVQWMQQYDVTDELVAMIARSLSASFADYRIYLTTNFDIIIIASAEPLGAINDQVLAQPGLHEELTRVGLGTPADLSWHEVGDRHSLLPLFDVLSGRVSSDFRPILSLEAPAARFEGKHSIALLNVVAADLPVRQVLAGLTPAPDPDQLAVNPYFEPTLLVHGALKISKALAEGSDFEGDASLAAAIAKARLTIGTCKSENPMADIDALVQLAGKTIPYLNSDRLVDIWSAPRWITCTSQSDAVRNMLALLDALARRDFASVHDKAVSLLQTQSTMLSPSAHGWVVRTAMLAAIAERQYGEVERIEASFGAAEVSMIGAVQKAYLRNFAASAQPAAHQGAH